MFVVSNILRICTNRRSKTMGFVMTLIQEKDIFAWIADTNMYVLNVMVCILLFYVIPLKIAMWIDQWGRYKTVTYLIVQVVPGSLWQLMSTRRIPVCDKRQNIQLESVRGRFVTENLSFMFFLSYLRYNKRWMFVVSNKKDVFAWIADTNMYVLNVMVCILLFYVIPLKIAMWIDQWGRYKTVTYLIVQEIKRQIQLLLLKSYMVSRRLLT
jgi:ribosomal protein L31E